MTSFAVQARPQDQARASRQRTGVIAASFRLVWLCCVARLPAARASTRQASLDVLAGGAHQATRGPRPDVVHGLLPGPRVKGHRRLSLPAVMLDERGEAVVYLV